MRFSPLLQALPLVSIFAVVGCGSSEAGAGKTFDTNLCAGGNYLPLKSANLGASWDGIAIMQRSSLGGSKAPISTQTTEMVGKTCGKVQDVAACESAIATGLVGSTWVSEKSSGCCSTRSETYVVATRGSEVRVIKSPAEFVATFGNVDTHAKAGLLVALSGKTLQCSRANARKEGASFEVLTTDTDTCNNVTEGLYRVSLDGKTELLETVKVKDGGGACAV